MVTVEFLGPIKREPVKMEAKTLADVAKELKKDPELRKWLSECAVAVNDTLIEKSDIALKEGDRISLLPPVCGG